MCMLHYAIFHSHYCLPSMLHCDLTCMHQLAWNLKLIFLTGFQIMAIPGVVTRVLKILCYSSPSCSRDSGWDVSKDKMKSGFLKLLNIEQVGLEDFDEEEEIELGQTEEQHLVIMYGFVSWTVPEVSGDFKNHRVTWESPIYIYYMWYLKLEQRWNLPSLIFFKPLRIFRCTIVAIHLL